MMLYVFNEYLTDESRSWWHAISTAFTKYLPVKQPDTATNGHVSNVVTKENNIKSTATPHIFTFLKIKFLLYVNDITDST